MGCCDKDGLEKCSQELFDNFNCPECHDNGVKIKIITPQTLLKESSKSKINTDLIYKFCKNQKCEIVYFSSDKNNFFKKHELTIKATLKDKGLDVNICYCFNYTRQSVVDELIQIGTSSVIDDIKKKMKDPGCFCEMSNPQGGCCLTNSMEWVIEAKKITGK